MAGYLTLVTLAVFMTLFINDVLSKRYCTQDTDCSDLGELYCIKSMCNWGVCGCHRDKVAKYLGQKYKYKCVPLRKVGEKCSNRDDDGVCGATNSYCDETKDECVCDANRVAVWGGERCESRGALTAGETCSNSIGSCSINTGSSSSCKSTGYSSTYWYRPVVNDVPTCACSNGRSLQLVHDMTNPYVHRYYPSCEQITHGDKCVRDGDCGSSTMQCNPTTFVCECKTSGDVKNYYGTSCYKPLAFGAACASPAAGYHCDGTLGLVCGDQCAVTGTNEVFDSTRTCTCGPYHSLSGSSCTLIGNGGTCYGDENCKGWKKTAVCVDSKCVDAGAAKIVAVMLTLIMPLLAMLLKY